MLSNYMDFVVTVGVLPLTFPTIQAGTRVDPSFAAIFLTSSLFYMGRKISIFLLSLLLPSLYLLLCETKIDLKWNLICFVVMLTKSFLLFRFSVYLVWLFVYSFWTKIAFQIYKGRMLEDLRNMLSILKKFKTLQAVLNFI